MADLLLKEFDLSEFNRWMLNIQKASEDLNFVLKRIKEIGYEENALNDWLKNPDMICKEILSEEDTDLKSTIYRIHELLTSYGLRPEDLFEEKNGKIVISEHAEHSYFICNANYLDSGEKVLSTLYDISDSLEELKKHGICLHSLQYLFVEKDGKFDINMENFKKFIEDSEL